MNRPGSMGGSFVLAKDDGASPGWLDAFAEHPDRQRDAVVLARILKLWDLNQIADLSDNLVQQYLTV